MTSTSESESESIRCCCGKTHGSNPDNLGVRDIKQYCSTHHVGFAGATGCCPLCRDEKILDVLMSIRNELLRARLDREREKFREEQQQMESEEDQIASGQ